MATLTPGRSTALGAQTGLWSWITTVDHKRIGILYMLTGFLMFLVSGVMVLLVRTQLAQPGLQVLAPDTYNQLVTMHALIMVFGAVMPISAGFMNYLIPLQIGARDVAFPRLNALSYWILLFAGVFLLSSFIFGGAPGQGWTAYTSLSTLQFAPDRGMDFYVLAALLLGISSLLAAVNFMVTILNMRAPGMSMFRLPPFTWSTFFTSILLLVALPPFTIALILLGFDRWFGAVFFSTAAGANQLLWQHLFWLFGHPEVYIMIIPAFGIVSEIIPTFSGKPLFGYLHWVGSLMVLTVLSYVVWSHHMFTVGMGPVVDSYFTIATMLISVPTGVLIFNWLGTMWGGRIRLTAAMLYALGFIAQFTIGGVTGVILAASPSNQQLHDTYFVIGHFHYVLVGGLIFSLFAAVHYWLPKISGRLLSERLGKWSFWLTAIGFNLTFMPQHWIGLFGMPRRVYTYPAELGLAEWNLVSTVGAYLLGAAVMLFMYNLAVTFVRPAQAMPGDVWDGRTLEWSIPTPPPVYNFAIIPAVRGVDAWWIEKESDTPAAGPSAGGRRRLSVHMPSPSYWPIGLALALLVGAYGMVFDSRLVGALGLLLVLGVIITMSFESTAGYHIDVEEG